MTHNAKGPAATAIAPDRGSTNPAKDKEMNKITSSTSRTNTPVGEAMTEKPKTISDLFEGPIDDARRMSSILAGLLEDGLATDMTDFGRPSCYFLTSDQTSDLLFSIYQVQGFINKLQDAFEEATR
jgi:hypothetical protein